MKFKTLLINILTVILLALGLLMPVEAKVSNLEYRAHVSEKGWMDYVTSPNEAGTTGLGLPMEALEIKEDPNNNIDITIEAHVQDIGWMTPVTNDIAGTVGQARHLEAVKLSVTGGQAEKYDVKYQAHVANVGWMDWVENGQVAGTTGKNQAIEAIRIEVERKDGQTDPNDSSGFVALVDTAPDILQEVRYYTSYNFVGKPINGYEEPTILMTRQTAEALKAINDELMAENEYRLKVYDAYRPQMAVDHFVEWAKDLNDQSMKPYFYPEVDKTLLFEQDYIAEKSGHTRGSTVDLTIFDMKTGKDLDMGGTFDYFGERSHPDYREGITQEQYENRMLLREKMVSHGFRPLASEWWHFTLNDEPYSDTYFNFPVKHSEVE